MTVCVNLGCGRTPTPGWHNYDNSWSIRLARRPFVALIFERLGLLQREQRAFVDFCRSASIQLADATKRIPEKDNTVTVLYSSHMLEHLDREEACRFLAEARRVLKPGGILRLAVPDLQYHVRNYMLHGNADQFVEELHLTRPKAKTLRHKLHYLIVGDRQHHWMYDGKSLCRLLTGAGFVKPIVMQAGTTMIPEPGALDLREREKESVYVEAISS